MPQIKEFTADAQVHPVETGIEATAQAARRIGAFSNQQAGTIERLGSAAAGAVRDAGDVYVDYEDHRQITLGAAKFATLSSDLTDEWNTRVKTADPNDPSVAGKYKEEVLEPALEGFGQGFTTAKSQKWAEAHIDQFRQHMTTKTTADMAQLAGDAVAVNMRETVNSLSNTVHGDPTSLDFALGQLESGVGASIDTSPNLKGTQAAQVRNQVLEKGREQIVKSAALGQIEKTGALPDWVSDPKYSKYVNGVELKQFEMYARSIDRAQRADTRDAEREQDRRDRQAALDRSSELATKYIDPNTGAYSYPANFRQQVLTDPVLRKYPAAMRETLREYDAAVKGQKDTLFVEHSRQERMRISNDIGRSSDDSKRMHTEEPIWEAFRAGKLSRADRDDALKEFRDQRQPGGEKLYDRYNEFTRNMRHLIDKSNPLMGTIDPSGGKNFDDWKQFVQRKIDEYKRTPGKNPWDLFDDSKPDYVGSPAVLSNYQKDISSSIRDATKRVTPRRIIPPKLPGESAEDYEARVGGKK